MEGRNQVQAATENPRSHYNRFLNSQRRIQVYQSNENLTARVHPKYPRNAEAGIQKAINIDKEVTKGSANDTPSPNKYKKSTIFDHDEAESNAKGYRGTNAENINRVINNNTQFRIFNQIRPRDGKVAPLENLNLNPNKWKPKLTYYYQENRGDVTDPKNNTADADYYNPLTTKSKRESRLLNSKRQLQEYLDNVKSETIYSIQHLRNKLDPKSVLNKLPVNHRSAYATPEVEGNSRINKTIERMARDRLDVSKSNDFGIKNPAPSYPVLDVKNRIIKDHQTNIDLLRSRRYGTININERNFNPTLTKSPDAVQTNLIVSPQNPRPVDFIKNVSKLEVSGSIDKVGGITYRGNNSQTVNPMISINEKGVIKPQITSVYEKNKLAMKSKYPDIAPVFKLALPEKVEISKNPMLKLDTIDYDGVRRSYQQSPVFKGVKPEFMDLLSMSKKLDSSTRIGK